MIKSYITLALRNLVRNKLSSIINLVGLATAIGCSVVIFAFVHYLYNQDSFHENADAIFMVENEIELGGETKLWALAPAPLAPALKADFPQVKYAVRIENEYATAAFRYRDKVFKENFFYVDPEFLEMFTFRLKHGVKTALRQKNNIVLSDETAKKYFGDINPVGEQMALKYPNRPAETVTVAGVVEAFPANSSLRFCILMSYEKRRDFGHEGLEDWGNFTRATFIQLNAPDEIAAISGQVEHYIQAQNEARIDWHIRRMLFEPLSKAAINAYRVNGALLQGAPPAGAVAMGFMMISLLSLACFNYMNIAIGTATRRLKEIGLRKVVGGTRANLVKQFLSENIVLCLIALCMGVVLAQAVFLPGLNSVMSNFGLRIPLTLLDNLPMWYYLGALLLLTGIGAGLYPALYISKFKPVAIFQGKQRLGGRNLFTRLLLTAQFVFSFMTIFAGFTVNQNVAYQRSRDWGYNQAQTIVIPLDEEGEFEKLKNIVGRNSNVVRVAGSVNHIGANSNSGLVKVDGKKYDVRRFQVGYDYPETMGMRLAEGRFFDRAMITDLDEAILVNKTFAREAN
ncbi:MAG: ABC transporter permease, partial [bacterium]